MMTIALKSPELEGFVQEKVAGGLYRSPEDVIAAALALLQHDPDRDIAPEELAELRQQIDVGIAQLDRGDLSPWTADTMKAKVRDSLASRKR